MFVKKRLTLNGSTKRYIKETSTNLQNIRRIHEVSKSICVKKRKHFAATNGADVDMRFPVIGRFI